MFLFLTACAPDTAPAGKDDAETQRIDESTPAAFGVLGFLNDAATTESVLDDEVGLDSRAAGSLIEHRNGNDGVFGTNDDDLFDTIAEVDAQYYVGNSALNKLLQYAEAFGYVPGPTDPAGSWEGVDFTVEEVGWTLDLANNASHEELDDDVGLDKRAADGIVDGRPFDTIPALANAYYVGKRALTDLRNYSRPPEEEPPPDLAGVHEDCKTSEECEEGLKCIGELAYNGGLFCVDTWGVFENTDPLPIPDDGTTVSSTVTVSGLASVPVDVVLTVHLDHDRPSDLQLSIENFNGYGATLWNNDDNPEMEMIVRAFPSDDEVHGDYTISFTDTVSGVAGTLTSWELLVVSTYD